MPRITPVGQTVENAAMPTNRLSLQTNADMFGAAEARQMAQLGTAIGNMGEVAMKKYAESEALKTKALARDDANGAESETRQLMMNIYAKRGKDALNVTKEAEDGMKAIRQKYLQSATNADQKAYFTTYFDSVMKSNADMAMSHQMKQTEAFNDETTLAQNESFKENMMVNYTNPTILDQNAKDLELNVRAFGARKGMDASAIQQAIEKERDDAYMGIVGRMSQDSTIAALKFMDDNKDKFNPSTFSDKRAQVEKSAKGEVALNTALELANSGLPIEEQLAKVDQIKDPAVVAATRKIVIERHEENQKIEKAKDEEYIDSEINKLIQNPKAYKLPPFAPEKLATFVATHRKKLIDEVSGAYNGTPVVTDWSKYQELGSMIRDGKYVDMTQYRESFTTEDFKHLMNMQLMMRDPGNKQKVDQLFSTADILHKAISSLPEKEFDPKRGTAQWERYNALTAALQREVEKIPADKRDPETIGNIVKEQIGKVIVGKTWYGGDKEAYKFEARNVEAQQKTPSVPKEALPDSLKNAVGIKQTADGGFYLVDDRNGVNAISVYDKAGKYLGTRYNVDLSALNKGK